MEPEQKLQNNKNLQTILTALYIAVLSYASGSVLAWIFSFAQRLYPFPYSEMLGMITATIAAYFFVETMQRSKYPTRTKIAIAVVVLLVIIIVSSSLSLYLRQEAMQLLHQVVPG